MNLRIFVLNVGKGNRIVIPFPERLSIIDIDDSHIDEKTFLEEVAQKKKMPLTNPIDWLQSNYRDQTIFRFILTHPDMDHMSGLAELSKKKSILNFWSIPNSKEMSEHDFENTPYRYDDWKTYKNYESGKKQNTALSPLREQKSDCCWIQDGIRILGPDEAIVQEANEKETTDSEKYNHASYVLAVKHKTTGRQVIFGGDSTKAALDNIAQYYRQNHDGKPFDRLWASVVIAPHHGSKNNTSKNFMDAVNPSAVIVPVKWGVDYDRQFYQGYGDVFATKTSGNICIELRGNIQREVAIWTQATQSWQIVRKDNK